MTIRRQFWSRWSAALLVLAGCLLAAPASAQEAVDQAPSLRWVPGDAAAYSVMLRAREQIEAILHSKAWARLNELPFAKMAWKQLEDQWANPKDPGLAKFRKWYETPGHAELVRFLSELFEEEVFFYSGKNAADLVVLIQELLTANQLAPLTTLLREGPGGFTGPQTTIKVLLQTLDDNRGRLRVPDLVLGFRLSRTKSADAAKRLAELEKAIVKALPDMKEHLKKTKIHGAQVHTLVLESKVIPWDMIPFQMFEDKPGQFEKLMQRLKELNLTISLTVRGNYVLLGLGESTAGLQEVGENLPNRLAKRAEMAVLAKAAGRRLDSVGYISKDFLKSLSNTHYLKSISAEVHDYLKRSNLPAEKMEKIEKELKALSADVKRLAPELGASVSFTFLTDQGTEGYAYNWTKTPGEDASKALTLLHHVGGHPLGFVLARNNSSGMQYEVMARTIKLAHQAFEDLALPMLPDQVKELYETFMKQALPLFARLDRATAKMLLPALDGQGGLVLDARLKSKQWHEAMPAADHELPLPELGLVVGVRDAALLRKAFHEYREVFNELTQVVANVVPVPIPEIKIPEPQTNKTKAGTLYYWPLPLEVGLDQKLMPTGGISDKVAVFTFSHEHAERLLTRTAWKAKSGPLADPSRPLASAAYFNWAGLVDAAGPWVEYALTQAGQGHASAQARTVMDVLKVLRGYSSATYLEEGVMVTHSLTIIQDVK